MSNRTSPANENTPGRRVIRAKSAIIKVAKGRTAFYEMLRPQSKYFDPTFPERVQLGLRSVGWFEHEIDAWLFANQNRNTGGVL